MTRPRSPISCAALAALALALASTARAQDDLPALAKRAEEARAKLQAALAASAGTEKLLRLDKFEAGEGNLKVTGAFLRPQPVEGEKADPFEDASAKMRRRLETALGLKDGDLKDKLDLKGVALVPADKHPHVVLQRASNAAGATDPAADRFLFRASSYGPTGALVVSGVRAPGAAGAKWLEGEWAKLGPANGVPLKGGKPDATDAVKEAEWKVSAAAVQGLLAARKEPGARRIRAARAYFAYPTDDKGTVDAREPRLFVPGLRLGREPFDVVQQLAGEVKQLWPDLIDDKRITFDLNRVPIDEPVERFRAELARATDVTAVRADPGAEFDANGVLTFKGVRPELSEAETRALVAAWQRVLAALAQGGDDAAPVYAELAKVPVSAAKMARFEFDKVLAGARRLARTEMDDALVSRLYFNKDGALQLQVRTVQGTDHRARLDKAFKDLQAEFLKNLPGSDAAPAALDASAFDRSFTARLRAAVARDQQKWNGVYIARGFFDEFNRYTLRGAVDAPSQNDALDTELTKVAAENATAYGPFLYAEGAPETGKARTANRPALEVLPMKDLVARARRVAPAYGAFDGVRVVGARYDETASLVFDAHLVGRTDPAAAPLLTQLLREHPTFAKRTPADRPVKIERDTSAPGDEQLADLGLAYGAKLLTKPHPSAADRAKALEWLEASRLHYPNESGVWFLSAYYHHTTGDAELARRDLFRVVELEGRLAFDGPLQRKRRSDAAKDLQGAARADLDALWLDAFRAFNDGEPRLTMTPRKQ